MTGPSSLCGVVFVMMGPQMERGCPSHTATPSECFHAVTCAIRPCPSYAEAIHCQELPVGPTFTAAAGSIQQSSLSPLSLPILLARRLPSRMLFAVDVEQRVVHSCRSDRLVFFPIFPV